jgi:hypothetical protein
MNNTALTAKDTNCRYLQVRSDLLEIFGWDLPAASVCQILMLRDQKLYERTKQAADRWFVMTTPEIYDWGLTVVGTTYIDKAIARLSEIGVISTRRARIENGPREIKVNTAVLNPMLLAVANQQIDTPQPGKSPNRRRKHHDLSASVNEAVPQICGSASTNLLDPSSISVPQICGSINKTIGTLRKEEKQGTPEAPLSNLPELPLSDQREQHVQPNLSNSHNALPNTSLVEDSTVTTNSSTTGEEEKPLSTCFAQGVAGMRNTSNPEHSSGMEQPSTHPHNPSRFPTTVAADATPTNNVPCAAGEAVADADESWDYRVLIGSYQRHCRKAKKPSGMEKKRAEEWASTSQLPWSYIERELEAFGSDQWAQDNGYPILAFIKRVKSGDGGAPVARAQSKGSRTSNGNPRSPRPVVAPPSAPVTWDASVPWNNSVQHAPQITVDAAWRQRYAAVTADMEFQSQFSEIVAKADALHEKCPRECEWLTLTWVVGTKPGESEPNWKKLLGGKLDFLLERAAKKAASPDSDRMAAWVAKARADIGRFVRAS